MYSETVFISKIVDSYRVLENKDCGFGPRKIDLKDPGFLLFTSSSGYEGYALTECHSRQTASRTPRADGLPGTGSGRGLGRSAGGRGMMGRAAGARVAPRAGR